MLERHELHGYRDGADWKFKVEDIDRLVAQPAEKPAEEAGGDVLLSEVVLGQSDPGLSGTVIGMSDGGRLVTDSDVRLADSDRVLDAAAKTPPKGVAESKFDDLNLSLESDLKLEDSKPSTPEKPAAARGGGSSVIDLSTSPSDDELVLGGSSGTGSDVTLGGDSGISLVDPSDSGLSLETPLNLGPVAEESLELGEDDMLTTSQTVGESSSPQLKADDDFLLTPLDETADTEESGSQVIALDTEAEEAGIGTGVSMAAMLDEDLTTHSGLEMAVATPAGADPGWCAGARRTGRVGIIRDVRSAVQRRASHLLDHLRRHPALLLHDDVRPVAEHVGNGRRSLQGEQHDHGPHPGLGRH